MIQLEIKNLKKIYLPNILVLEDINLEVKKGEFLVIVGRSGSGKSTLLRCINRLIEPTAGKIIFEGKDVTNAPSKELRRIRSDIAMIFQHFNLIERSQVLTNVLTGRLTQMGFWSSILGHFSPELKQEALEKLEMVGIPEQSSKRADTLSGGQQQRVGIARALMQEPKMLLADEPVSSLDPAIAESIMNYLIQMNKEGITVITVLHYWDLILKYGDRVVALKRPHIIYDGPPQEIDERMYKEVFGEEAEKVKSGRS